MIWKKIEKELKKRDWSIYKLTQKAGLTKNYLYNMKAGLNDNPSFEAMIQIADALEISLDEFREGDK